MFSFFVLLLFGFSNVYAESREPIITYKINGVSDNIIVTNPITNPIQLDFISDENIENWVSLKIENISNPNIYKLFYPRFL